MKSRLLCGAFVAMAAVVLLLPGCALKRDKAPAQVAADVDGGRKWFGPASGVVVHNLRLFIAAGAFLAAAGGLGGFLFRSPALAISLGGTGIALGAAATLFSQYPWFLLASSLGGLILLAVHVILNMRTIDLKTKAEKYIALAVETSPGGRSVKDALKEMGKKATETVKKVITPIKNSANIEKG